MTQNPSTHSPVYASTQLSDELRFLVACCQAEPTPDDIDLINAFLDARQFEPHALLKLAGTHGVIPLVYKTLKKLDESDLLNAERSMLSALISDLKSAYMQIAQRNMLMSAELLRIMKLLESNGIGALAFKGPGLAQLAYGDITLRQFGDLDVLIKKEHAIKTVSLLERDGYVPEIMLSGSKKEAFFTSVNVIGLEKASRGLRAEVHWELVAKNYAISWDQEPLWSQKQCVVINGREVPLLSPAHHLLYLCVHGSKHLYERFEWLTDIDRSVRTTPNLDWEFIFSEAEKMGTVRMVLLSLRLCRELLALPLPAGVNDKIANDKTACELAREVIQMLSGNTHSGKTYGTFGMLWRMRERCSDRIRFALYGLFAPKFGDFKFMPLPKPLLFLYPAVRFFRLTAKYLKPKNIKTPNTSKRISSDEKPRSVNNS